MNTYIFDLDGTIVNTLDDITYSLNLMLNDYGLSKIDVEATRKYTGNGARKLVERVIPDKINDEKFISEALKCYQRHYDENTVINSYIYDGFEEVLRKLKCRGYNMAVISNKDDSQVKRIIDTLIPNVFDVVQGYTKKFPHKPSPESLDALISLFGVDKSEVVFVGDSSVDVLTAKNAGVFSVGVSWGFAGMDAFLVNCPDVIINHPKELLEI